jgi:CPA2 family monovalent cation:H+ antiporter-2
VANPTLEISARAHFDAEVTHLIQLGVNTVVMGEREIARTMLEHTLDSVGQSADAIMVPTPVVG